MISLRCTRRMVGPIFRMGTPLRMYLLLTYNSSHIYMFSTRIRSTRIKAVLSRTILMLLRWEYHRSTGPYLRITNIKRFTSKCTSIINSKPRRHHIVTKLMNPLLTATRVILPTHRRPTLLVSHRIRCTQLCNPNPSHNRISISNTNPYTNTNTSTCISTSNSSNMFLMYSHTTRIITLVLYSNHQQGTQDTTITTQFPTNTNTFLNLGLNIRNE
eukprot:TRINITY_DN12703_c0_g1_i1.p2 TRINITY_DN12703_c0_g1~~TRINITY_DN12703_c0_g1_i1.p2  ORF type:complete len:215 (-),score=28.17 TRINITY_DN12703_c0_g1_i1:39-683(-)